METEGRFTTGMLLADRCDRTDNKVNPPNVEACLDVDTERFMQLFAQLGNKHLRKQVKPLSKKL